MLKKFFTIFKRDKSGFSNEELEWQKKVGKILNWILWGAIVVLALVLAFFFGDLVYERLENSDSEITLRMVTQLTVMIITIIVGGFVKNRVLPLEECKQQLEENHETEKREKLLAELEEGEFSELEINETIIYAVQNGWVKVILKPDGNKEIIKIDFN